MNTRKILSLILVVALVLCAVMLTACDEGSTAETKKPSSNNSSSTKTDDAVLHFVAADKTDWDMEVTIGDYNYTLAIDLKSDNTLTVAATCTGRYEANAGGNNMGGSGATEETQAPAETQAPMTDADKQAQNFSYEGTWTYEKGYGYTLTFPNGTVKTDFDKAASRQYFYTEIVKDDLKSDLVQFQAKDSNFRKEIAADYVEFEERDAEYIFSVVVIGNNNPNSTHLYLEKDGVANSLTYSGSSPTYKRGMWNIDPEDNLLTVYIEDAMYKGDYCDIAGKEGWRLRYNSNTMYSRDDVEYTAEDFEGKVTAEIKSEDGSYTLKLTEKGFAVVVDGDGNEIAGKYTGEADAMVVTLDGVEYKAADGKITISFEKSSGSGSGTETVEATFPLAK